MQRKNSILKKQHKNAMALIMAIAVIIIISTIMALSLALTTQTSKKTLDLYLYEQSMLLSKSATEFALLEIAKNNTSANPCNYTGSSFVQDGFYQIDISVRYVYTSFPASCAAAQQFATVQTAEQNGSALIDVAVSVNNTTVSSEPIRYFRRTIQKL
jgi:hypothetical protein